MKKLTTSEMILQYMINKNSSSSNNTVTMTQEDVNKLKLPELDIIRVFYLLEADGYLKITRECHENDFSTSWSFELKSEGIHYFEKKNEIRTEKRNKWIQFWIPVGISLFALIISGISLVLDLISK